MQQSFQYKNSQVCYMSEGQGFPVILVHGFGEDRTIWMGQAGFLSKYCRIIVPDLPGSGDSPVIKEPAASTIDFYADCIHALLKHEKTEQCIMLGHSMGGYITLCFAEKYPLLLKGFGLIHSTAYADSEEKKLVRQRGIEAIEIYGSYYFLKNTIPNLFGTAFKKVHPEKVEELIERGNNFDKSALQQYSAAMMLRPDRKSVLEDSEIPVLFILGTEDVAAPLEDVLQQVHLPKSGYMHLLEKAGHMGMWENETKMNHAMLEFIEDITTNS